MWHALPLRCACLPLLKAAARHAALPLLRSIQDENTRAFDLELLAFAAPVRELILFQFAKINFQGRWKTAATFAVSVSEKVFFASWLSDPQMAVQTRNDPSKHPDG